MVCAVANGIKGLRPLKQGNVCAQPFEGLTVAAVRCADCGYIRFPSPSTEVLGKFYRETYGKHAASWYTADNDFSSWKRVPRADRIISISSKFGQNIRSSYHEVGCSFGGTVFELQQRGYDASGTDLNIDAIAEGKVRGALNTAAMPDPEYLKSRPVRPSVVYGFHVLEHMQDPVAYLQEISSDLADGAIIIMMVPNAMALYALVYGYLRYNWFSFPGHLHYYSAQSALCLAKAAGLELLSVSSHAVPGVSPSVPTAALGPSLETPMAQYLHKHVLEAGFLAEELQMVFAMPATARHFESEVRNAKLLCEKNAEIEREIRAKGETAQLAAP